MEKAPQCRLPKADSRVACRGEVHRDRRGVHSLGHDSQQSTALHDHEHDERAEQSGLPRTWNQCASPTMAQLRRGTAAIISKQVSMRQSFYDRNHVPVYQGQARFVDEHSISIDGGAPIRSRHFRDRDRNAPVSTTACRLRPSTDLRQRYDS